MKNAEDIQKLRDMTGAGVMECKRALEEAGGNLEKATALLRVQGLAKTEKRMGRETGAGLITSYVHAERIGVLLDLRAETDFVVHSDPFRELAKNLAMHIAAANPENNEALLKQPYVRDESQTIEAVIKSVIARVGENITVHAFSRLEL